MASIADTSTNPYDVLAPVSSGDETPQDQDLDTGDTDPGTDTSTDDTDAEEVDTDAEPSDEDGESAEEGDPEQAAADKANDAAWKAKEGNIPPALKELLTANPQHAKKLKEMYFTNQRLTKFGPAGELKRMSEAVAHVGGLDKLIELKNQIDMMGGEQGFQEATQELESWRGIDEQWVNGDPALADHLASVNPASFEKIAPVMFGKLAEVNPDLYNNLGAQLITITLGQDGTIMNLQFMQQALAGGNTEVAGQYLKKITDSVGRLQTLASQAPKTRAADPKQQAWEQEKKGYEEKLGQQFQSEILSANESWMNPKISGELASYLKGAEKKLSPNTLQRIDSAVKTEIWEKHLKTNATFMKQRDALYAKRDVEAVKRLYQQYADKLFPTVTRQIAKEFSVAPAAKRAPGAPISGKPNAGGGAGKPVQEGFQKTTKMPSLGDVDRRKTTDDMIIKDQYILKDGRKVQVVSR